MSVPQRHRSASVVIANYNYAHFLRDAVDSALAQTHADVEVIVVDDGSVDDSREVIDSYGARIRAVFKANGGHGSAFNAGFVVSRGDVIFFLDADDAMLPNEVSEVLAAWRDGAVMMQFRMETMDSDGKTTGIHPPAWQVLDDGDVSEQVLSTGRFATTVTSGLAFSRDTLERVMPIPEKVFSQAADGYLVRAVALLGPVQALDATLARYRRHSSNDSTFSPQSEHPAQFFRKKLKYLRNEFEAVRNIAHERGLHVADDLGERDLDYLACRFYSLALDAPGHPLAGDRRMPLLMRYLAGCLSKPEPLSRRMADAATAVGVAVLPTDARETIVRWRQMPSARPWWLKRFAGT